MNAKNSLVNNVTLFRSLFNGREDVFATKWTKGNKSGYAPAYTYDPYQYKRHQLNGGTFKNFSDKRLSALTDDQIIKHLEGWQQIGIYPLLSDNTSWFIVADFDKDNWQKDAAAFIELCEAQRIPAYLERSQSGNGGHAWIFFEDPYPAFKSRKILISLLQEAGIFSVFDKSSSFDRLFPNQDYHSGKGFGNLIALPFFKTALEQGNNCFVDPDTLIPYEDQWGFLENADRISTENLDKLYYKLDDTDEAVVNNSEQLLISLSNKVKLNRSAIPIDLTNFLKEEFNLVNPEFFVKKNSGANTWNTPRFFKMIEESDHEILLPRGSIGGILRFCKSQDIDFEFIDKRNKAEDINFSCDLNLLSHQTLAVDAASKKDFGVIVAPPGSGKTVIALKLIADKKQPALIIVHRKQLLEQWLDRIESFLHIPKKEIGRIGHGRLKIGKKVTVAMIQSLGKKISEIETTQFKTVIIDECHHIPAQSFQETISNLTPYYQYGLTATPFRKYTDGKLIFAHLGELIADIKPNQIEDFKRAKIIVRTTQLEIPFNSKTDRFETLSNVLIHDSARNNLILNDVNFELKKGNKSVIITERKEHIETLAQFLKQNYEVVTLSGDDPEKERSAKMNVLNGGDFQVLITTGQLFGEGSDVPNISCLFLVYPFSFKGKLIQYIGRVQRGEQTSVIYDYRDQKIDYLNKMFLKRNVHYRHLDRQETLFDDLAPETTEKSDFFLYKETTKISINDLDFRYGSVGFVHKDKTLPMQLDIEIEHGHIRPEFDVLKPYFIKTLGQSKIEVNIYAEFKGDELIAQTASSAQLESINRELIEGVRFRFVEKTFFSGKGKPAEVDDQENEILENTGVYDSGEDLLEDILNNRNVKHYGQLRYLADLHERKTLKLKYLLNPFSFVFLLSGKNQYHIVLETLDTEEATYIWHVPKEKLNTKLDEIDSDLGLIRNVGRQAFLETQPMNFSKIIHDYSDERKGFVVWKGMLEERLY